MISVPEALQRVLDHAGEFGIETIPLGTAVGRVLAETLSADRDMPPYNRVTVDGIALRAQDFHQGIREFRIVAQAPAGTPQSTLPDQPGSAIEIMTGACLPLGADAVVKYEELAWEGQHATIAAPEVAQGQNIHQQGMDKSQGAEIVRAGQQLSLAEIGVAASVGKSVVRVKKLPRVAIVSTGDELVSVETQPQPYQIRQSNSYVLQALVQSLGMQAERFHLPDHEGIIMGKLEEIISTHEVILISGGVSKGKLDYVPGALDRLGVKKAFHQVAQRPGKPFWFGKSRSNTVVFAFPGNPVSITVCALVYFVPWFHQSLLGYSPPRLKVKLHNPVEFRPALDYFVPAKILPTGWGLEAEVSPGHGSGDHANLVLTDGFVHLPQGKDLYPAGEMVDFIPYKSWFV